MGKSIKDRLYKEAGFSLAEIIAVLAIIAILASAVIGVGRYAVKRARVGKARATLEKLSLAIELYRQDFGMYIPDSKDTKNGQSLSDVLDRVRWPSGYTDALGHKRSKPTSLQKYDKPSEILFFFIQEMYEAMNFDAGSRQDNKTLLASLVRTKAYVKFKRNELADTDGDELPEIIDGWGMPFLYVGADRMRGDGLANVEPHEGKNPESFSLYSFGPNKLGSYDANPANRAERDYPVGDLDFNGESDNSDKTEMAKRIRRLAEREGSQRGTTLANNDNLTNWERER